MNLSAKSAMIVDWMSRNTEHTVIKPVEELAQMIAADLELSVSAMYLRKLRKHYCKEANLQLQTARRGGGGPKQNKFGAMVSLFSDLAERINRLTDRLNTLARDLADAGITAPYNAAPLPTDAIKRPDQPQDEAPFVEEIPAEIVDSVHYHETEATEPEAPKKPKKPRKAKA